MFFRTGSSIAISIIFIILAMFLVIYLLLFIIRKTSRPATDALREASVATERKDAKSFSAAPFRAKQQVTEAQGSLPTGLLVSDITTKASGTLISAQRQASDVPEKTISKKTFTSPFAVKQNNEILASFKQSTGSKTVSGSDELTSGVTTKNARSGLKTGERHPEYAHGAGTNILSAFSKNKETDKSGQASFDATAYTEKVDSSQNISAVSKQQDSDKNERFAILNAAADKKHKSCTNVFQGAKPSEPVSVRGNSKIMLELFVDQQNTNIGKRNIHVMKAGTRLGIGGNQSPFLIFLVKFPPHIAEIRYDGISCDLAILKPEYFPYENENLVHGCIGRKFTIVSSKDYEVTFDIRNYEDPVVSLNRILNSINF
jgi:hypothetical protein